MRGVINGHFEPVSPQKCFNPAYTRTSYIHKQLRLLLVVVGVVAVVVMVVVAAAVLLYCSAPSSSYDSNVHGPLQTSRPHFLFLALVLHIPR